MDNASKALVMAGAILISIALVGVGVYIFTTTSNVSNQVGDTMTRVEIETTNNELRQYAGDGVRGSSVKALAEKVRIMAVQGSWANNIAWSGDSGDTIASNKLYDVVITDENTDGYLDNVEVIPAS